MNASISQIWELVYLLRQHNFHVGGQKCRHLDNVLYEDDPRGYLSIKKKEGRIRFVEKLQRSRLNLTHLCISP